MVGSREPLQLKADILGHTLHLAIADYNGAGILPTSLRVQRLRVLKETIDNLTTQLGKLEAQGIRPARNR